MEGEYSNVGGKTLTYIVSNDFSSNNIIIKKNKKHRFQLLFSLPPGAAAAAAAIHHLRSYCCNRYDATIMGKTIDRVTIHTSVYDECTQRVERATLGNFSWNLMKECFKRKVFIFVCSKERKKKKKREEHCHAKERYMCVLCFLKYTGVLAKHDDNDGGIVLESSRYYNSFVKREMNVKI